MCLNGMSLIIGVMNMSRKENKRVEQMRKLKGMSINELRVLLKEKRVEQFKLRHLVMSAGKYSQGSKGNLEQHRKEVARILTVLKIKAKGREVLYVGTTNKP